MIKMVDSRRVTDELLTPTKLSQTRLSTLLADVTRVSVDYADIYFQSLTGESWVLEEGIVKDTAFYMDRGVGVRAVVGEQTGFAFSNDLSFKEIQKLARSASTITSQKARTTKPRFYSKNIPANYRMRNPLSGLSAKDKVNWLRELDTEARRRDRRIKEVVAQLSAQFELVLIAASDGTWAADIRPLVRCSLMVIAQERGRREQGSSGGGGRFDYQTLYNRSHDYVDRAVHQALTNLKAIDAPTGQMPVVLGPGWPAIIFHEAVGHGLEGDSIRKGNSVFCERLNQVVASPLCTLVDSGVLPNARGSLNIDDEGTPVQETLLIQDGILKGFMLDKMNARLMGTVSSGNARRESYSSLPYPRMTNTYLKPGQSQPDEIIASVDRGIYAVGFAGGQVDVTSGHFVFTMSEAYLIEKGKIAQPIKGASLIGYGPTVLQNITMVGSDLAMDEGVGVCGKQGQSMPVGVGQPTLKVSQLTIGGTHAQK